METGLGKVNYVAAGKKGQVYALAAPKEGKDYTIYRLQGDKFVALEGKRA